MPEAGQDEIGRVPVPLTRLLGRDREVADLTALLDEARCVTILGTGGAGKTRLALALAAAAADRGGEVWWVDLAVLPDAALLPHLVATAVGVTDDVLRHLRRATGLLVLDNAEHVVDDCAAFAARLLACAPGIRVLTTSRVVLGVPGEVTYRLAGLAEPPAVALFLERARRGPRGRPALTAADAARVPDLCRRLDGIPLALELAAARATVLTVEEIARGLDDAHASGLRARARHAGPVDHETVRATLTWSHDLLDDAERTVFRRLGAFQGSFDLAGAEHIVAGGTVERDDVLAILARLVDTSLVGVTRVDGEIRYQLLHGVAAFAEEHLANSGERDLVQRAHAAEYVAVLEQADADGAGRGTAAWLRRLAVEHDNLRAALRRSLDIDPESAGRLLALLWPFWASRGYYEEGRAWLEDGVALGPRMSPPVRAATLAGAGVLAFRQCDYGLATERLEHARELCEGAGDEAGIATVLEHLGCVAREEGRYGDATDLHEQSLAHWEQLGAATNAATALGYLGFCAWLAGDLERAEALCRDSLARLPAGGHERQATEALVHLGTALAYRGAISEAGAVLREALDASLRLGFEEGTAWAAHELAILARRTGTGTGSHAAAGTAATAVAATAAPLLARALDTHHRLGVRGRTASVVEEIAALVADADPLSAAALLGAAEAMRDQHGNPLPPVERADWEATVARVRAALDEVTLERTWAAGASGRLDDAVDLARNALARVTSSRPAVAELTERECEVLRRMAEGRTNRQIGHELLMSPSTAGVHVSAILRKLGVDNRAEAAGAAARLGLL